MKFSILFIFISDTEVSTSFDPFDVNPDDPFDVNQDDPFDVNQYDPFDVNRDDPFDVNPDDSLVSILFHSVLNTVVDIA